MHPDQAQKTFSGIQGLEATAVAVIYVTAPTIAVPRSIWLPNNFRKVFAHFGQSWLMCLQIAMKIEKFYVSTYHTFIADRTTSLKWGSV